jgi:hypothetical protein
MEVDPQLIAPSVAGMAEASLMQRTERPFARKSLCVEAPVLRKLKRRE